ncbi:MAG: GAF domain-containing protein [Gammaproteobacteria bacterium]
MKISLDAIRPCFEGVVPSILATCDAAGIPNVTYVSQVHYVDASHVALTFQFFNKTRENILANPQATLFLLHPETSARYRLALLYRRTECEGPLFESMKAKLSAIASHSGMSGVFRLQGSDVYQVLDVEQVPGVEVAVPPAIQRSRMTALRAMVPRVVSSTDLATLLERTLAGLEAEFGFRHAMILFADAHRLYTVASRGYAQSGIGSEFPLGRGVIGVAAQYRTPIRIAHMTSEYSYGRAIREHVAGAGLDDLLETAIPFPGLPEPHSQLAVPVIAANRLLGVLHVESPEAQRFTWEDEDALVTIAGLLGEAVLALQHAADSSEDAARESAVKPEVGGSPLAVRHYARNDSVFLGEDYLIKGVAGAILWRLLNLYVKEQRTEFSNRELRLDSALKLPDVDDNLEARLILLQKRLAERDGAIVIEKTGRGRFRLAVRRPLLLQEVDGR